MTISIEGLDSSIKPMVSQYRQDNRDVSFLGLVNYAFSASRAKEKKTKKVTIQAPATLKVGSKPKAPTRLGKIAPQFIWQINFHGQREVVRKRATKAITKDLLSLKAILSVHRMKTDTEQTVRFGTSTVPTRAYTKSSYTEATDSVLVFRGRGHTPAPRIPIEDIGTAFERPGWARRPTARGPPRSP